MPDKAWKAFERRIAKSLGTHRTPLSGIGSRHTRSDTLHPHLYVECKDTAKSATCKLFRQTRIRAGAENKTPVVALHWKWHTGSVAVIDWNFFLQLWESYIDILRECGWHDSQGLPPYEE